MFATVLRLPIVIVMLASVLLAETDWGTIKGIVTDDTGATLSRVLVAVHLPATGFHRTALTSNDGSYVIPSVPVGEIDLTFELAGFQKQTIAGVHLATGQIWTFDARLRVATLSEAVDVRAETTRINRENAELGDVISSKQISEIPLNGRNWQGLLLLTPGAINTGSGDGRGIRFLGKSHDDNTFRFDGVDARGIRNQVPRDDIRLAIPLESIAEFRVRSGQYTAEAGGNMAAQVEIVSRSGANNFHGSLYEFFRNDKLDARSPFDPAKIPPFRLNQFGGSLGGRVVRDKVFFFTNYEGLTQRLAQTLIGFVPTDSFRIRALSTTPTVAPIVNAFPVATGASSSPDIGVWTGRGSQDNDQHSGMVRVDQHFTDRDLFFGRFNKTNMEARVPRGDGTGYLGGNANVSEQITNGVLSYQKVLSPMFVNDARVGVNRIPYWSRWDSPTIPAVTVAGFSTIPGARESRVNSTSFTFADTITWLLGRHTVKAGLDVRRLKMAIQIMVDSSTLAYQNPAAVANGELTSALVISPSPTRGVLKTQHFGFIQDEIKISPSLSVTVGLRYENFGVLREENDQAKPFDLGTCGGYCPQGSAFTFPDHNNFAPRFGVAWSPRALSGRTAIRSGFGMFYGEGQLGNQLTPIENLPMRVQLTGDLVRRVPLSDVLGLEFPSVGTPVTTAPMNMERRRKDMYITQWSLNVQQAILRGFAAEAGYLGSKGTQLFQRTYINALDPTTGMRPYPQFDLLRVRANGNDSSFHALMLSLRRQKSSGLTMTANYQWSHAIDNDTTGGDDADYPQNVACRSCEKASSNFDVRHNFTLNGIYELPFGPGKKFLRRSGIAGTIFGGWQLSGIIVARTGRPITITVSRATTALPDGNVTSPQRPDVILGIPLTPTEQTSNSWLNIAAFAVPSNGRWGNAGRNLVAGPGAVNLDASVSKRVSISERTTLDFRAEVFNVFNNPKYANPQANISAPATFGVITQLANTGPTGTGTARQIEFALRLSF